MGLTDPELHERLESRLMSHGIYVTDCALDEGTLHVGYETAHSGDGVAHREIGRVLNVLIDAREDGWKPTDVHGWVYDLDREPDDDPQGHWEANEGWFHALAADHLSETDFSTLVLSTIG